VPSFNLRNFRYWLKSAAAFALSPWFLKANPRWRYAFGIERLDRNGRRKIFYGFIVFAFYGKNKTPVEMRGGIAFIAFYGLAEIPQGKLEFALRDKYVAPVIVSDRMFWVDRYRMVVCREGAFPVALRPVGIAFVNKRGNARSNQAPADGQNPGARVEPACLKQSRPRKAIASAKR
jgi:hypothetical protein